MKDQLAKLEKASKQLEPDSTEREKIRNKVINYTENFLNEINSLPAYVMREEKGKGIFESPIKEEPDSIEEIINLVYKNVDTQGLNPASGGHLGYIPGGGIYSASLGDYMADITNRYAGIFFASPGAVRMENMLIDWMADMVGYKKGYAGNLTSGGSIANLIAIVTARDSFDIKARDIEKTVFYATEHSHHCIDKAIRIAGLKEAVRRNIPMDSNYRMNAEKLEQQISTDMNSGLKPFMIIASAGTTDVGAIDPLKEIGNLATKYKLWYHIDGAYGAFFALTDEGKQKLQGMELSDSIVMDPHKGLFLPYGLGTVIIKEKNKLYNSHYYVANYMQDAHKAPEELSPAELSPELTKHFRGLRLWLPLKLHGVKPFRKCLEEKLLLAKYFYAEVQKLGFEVGPEPELSVVTFRYVPENKDADKFNEMLVNEIHKDGRVFISSSKLDGKFILHLAILSFRTHLSTIDLALQVLKEVVEKVKSELKQQ
ncbi:MAG: pyridoxal phosphate-dependent decarboxylase family protein [Bacteroidia bacterium]